MPISIDEYKLIFEVVHNAFSKTTAQRVTRSQPYYNNLLSDNKSRNRLLNYDWLNNKDDFPILAQAYLSYGNTSDIVSFLKLFLKYKTLLPESLFVDIISHTFQYSKSLGMDDTFSIFYLLTNYCKDLGCIDFWYKDYYFNPTFSSCYISMLSLLLDKDKDLFYYLIDSSPQESVALFFKRQMTNSFVKRNEKTLLNMPFLKSLDHKLDIFQQLLMWNKVNYPMSYLMNFIHQHLDEFEQDNSFFEWLSYQVNFCNFNKNSLSHDLFNRLLIYETLGASDECKQMVISDSISLEI